jgi:hypothetical protein
MTLDHPITTSYSAVVLTPGAMDTDYGLTMPRRTHNGLFGYLRRKIHILVKEYQSREEGEDRGDEDLEMLVDE